MAASITAGRLSRRDDAATMTAAVALAVLAVVLLVLQQAVRRVEATFSAGFLRVLHVRPAKSIGISVVFPLHGHWVGYSLTVGCSAAFLVIPFVLISAGLVASRRVMLGRCLKSLAAVSVILFFVNQLRFLVIAASMVLWGYRTGYERSHVFFGTTLSTIGVVAGVIVFVFMLSGDGRRVTSSEGPHEQL